MRDGEAIDRALSLEGAGLELAIRALNEIATEAASADDKAMVAQRALSELGRPRG